MASKQESIKDESLYLKGKIGEELAAEGGFVSNESYELLKFHGSYQGYNRDTATQRKKAGLDKEWEFMLRMKCTGGLLSAKQYLALDSICDKYANGTMRITTRETFQFHCIAKGDLKAHIAAINELALTTLGGCGDVVRNVMCSPVPIKDTKRQRLMSDAHAISEHTAPKTSSYCEIWMDGKNINRNEGEVEPLYGKYYLTRKFKIGIIIPEDNSIDVFTHDLGIVSVYEGDELKGYNIYLGGGLGMTHNKPATYPRLASPIAFVEVDDLIPATLAAVKLNRDYCDRDDRKHARLKYLVEEKGLEWTKEKFDHYMGKVTENVREIDPIKVTDHMGWHEQGDGKYYLGVPVSSGRIVDRGEEKIRSGLYKVIEHFGTNIILTSDQNIIICDIEEGQKQELTDMLKSYGIKLNEDISPLYRNFLACVALPTCGKALAEAERVKLDLVAQLEQVMREHNLADEPIAIRIAGCPNGCSRPYVGEIGIVGRMPGHYAIYIGGDFEGTRLSIKILDRVPYDNIAEIFGIMLDGYVADGGGEAFGDYAHRVGEKNIANTIQEQLGDKYKWARAC